MVADGGPIRPSTTVKVSPSGVHSKMIHGLAMSASTGNLPRYQTRSGLLAHRASDARTRASSFLQQAGLVKERDFASKTHHVYNSTNKSLKEDLQKRLADHCQSSNTTERVVKVLKKKEHKHTAKVGWTNFQATQDLNRHYFMSSHWTSDSIAFSEPYRGDQTIKVKKVDHKEQRMEEQFYSSFTKDFVFREPRFSPNIRVIQRLPAPRQDNLEATIKSTQNESSKPFSPNSNSQSYPLTSEHRPYTPSHVNQASQTKIVYADTPNSSRPQTAMSSTSKASKSSSHKDTAKIKLRPFFNDSNMNPNPGQRPMSAPMETTSIPVALVRHSMMDILETRCQSRQSFRPATPMSIRSDVSDESDPVMDRSYSSMSNRSEGVRSGGFQFVNTNKTMNPPHSLRPTWSQGMLRPDSRQIERLESRMGGGTIDRFMDERHMAERPYSRMEERLHPKRQIIERPGSRMDERRPDSTKFTPDPSLSDTLPLPHASRADDTALDVRRGGHERNDSGLSDVTHMSIASDAPSVVHRLSLTVAAQPYENAN